MSEPGHLGRRVPEDFRHVELYPLRAILEDPQDELAIPDWGIEKTLGLPLWWKSHDQGQEGACVGFGSSAERAITNRRQRLLKTGKKVGYRYDARWLYLEAQLVDEWDDTPPGEGTSVRAAYEILRARGHRRVQKNGVMPENLQHGVEVYRWAQNHNEVRAAIAGDHAVSIGVSWYSSFDDPYEDDGELWIKITSDAWVRGGHCVCLYQMSDRRRAFRVMNSWGAGYPPVWLSYADLDTLLADWGEAAVVVDR